MVEVQPKDGWKIGVPSWGGGATVGEDGTAKFSGVKPGEYLVSIKPRPDSIEFQPFEAQLLTVEFGKTTEVKIVYR